MKQKYIYWAGMVLVWSFAAWFGHQALPEYARGSAGPQSTFILLVVVFLGFISPTIASWISNEMPKKGPDGVLHFSFPDATSASNIATGVSRAGRMSDGMTSKADDFVVDGLRMLAMLIGHIRVGASAAPAEGSEPGQREFLVDCAAVAERLAHLIRVKDVDGLADALRQADDLLTKNFKRTSVTSS